MKKTSITAMDKYGKKYFDIPIEKQRYTINIFDKKALNYETHMKDFHKQLTLAMNRLLVKYKFRIDLKSILPLEPNNTKHTLTILDKYKDILSLTDIYLALTPDKQIYNPLGYIPTNHLVTLKEVSDLVTGYGFLKQIPSNPSDRLNQVIASIIVYSIGSLLKWSPTRVKLFFSRQAFHSQHLHMKIVIFVTYLVIKNIYQAFDRIILSNDKISNLYGKPYEVVVDNRALIELLMPKYE